MAPLDFIRLFGSTDTIPADTTIEGYAVADIASAADEGNGEVELGYYDVLNFFSLTSDQYTPDHHARLLSELTVVEPKSYTLSASLPSSVRHRTLVTIGDLSPETLTTLAVHYGSLSQASATLVFGNRAASNAASAENGVPALLQAYMYEDKLLREYLFEDKQRSCSQRAPHFIKKLKAESDSERVRDIRNYFRVWGCGDTKFNTECVCRAISAAVPSGNSSYNRTWTAFDRTQFVTGQIVKKRDLFPHPVQRVLEVGPGLSPHDDESYEPFSLLSTALTHFGADEAKVHIDMIDISPRVLRHFRFMIEAAERGWLYELSFPRGANTGRSSPYDSLCVSRLFGDSCLIPPQLIRAFHPYEGDIATDRIADSETYDLMVMLYVFRYLDEEGMRVAEDTISRLLKTGGMFVTDIDPSTHLERVGLTRVYAYSSEDDWFGDQSVAFWKKD